MKKHTLLSFLSIVFLSLLFVGQNIAQDKASVVKNIGKFISASENGNLKDLQGASTAIITGTDKGANIHFDHPYNAGDTMHVFAGTFSGTLDGSNANFYCIDISHYLVYNQDYTDEGPTQAEITYVLNNYYPYASYPYTGSASTEQLEAAAVQAVMWHYADGMDLTTIQEAEVKSRAIAIAADADANAGSIIYPDYFSITPASQNIFVGEIGTVQIKALDTNGNPYPGLVINLASTSGTLSQTQVTTDANGEAIVTITQSGDTVATITAQAQVTIEQGTQYHHVANPNGKQKLVLATPTVATSQAQAQVTWQQPVDVTIGNYVWHDSNVDGIQDANEDPLENVIVELYDNNNNLIATTTTNNSGYYSFTNLQNGNYTVKIADANFNAGGVFEPSSSENWYLTYANKGNDDALDSDGDQNNSAAVTISNYNDDFTIDFGFFHTCVKLEKTGPQTILAGDIIEYTFTVHNCGDIVLHGGVSLYDPLLKPNGNHKIGNTVLEPDSVWIVKKSYTTTQNDCGTTIVNNAWAIGHPQMPDGSYKPDVRSDDNHSVEVTCNQDVKLGNYIWHDSNVDGIQDANEDPLENVVVELYDNNNNLIATTTTNSVGFYEFTQLQNGNYVVKVADANFNAGGVFDNTSDSEKWYITYKDKGNDDALDSDGDQNNSAAVTISNYNDDPTIDFGFFHTCVNLEKTGPQTILAGDIIEYTFTVHNCGDIVLHGGVSLYDPLLKPNGNHKIGNTVLEPDSVWIVKKSYTTTQNDCGTTIVNNAWAIGHPQMPDGSYKPNVRSDDNHSVEVTCNPKATIGDRVWYDTNENGIQDLGEDGVKNVRVNLYTCSGQFVDSKLTDNNGYYLFEDLAPGQYFVQFVLPNGYVFSSKDVGNNDAVDSDADVTTGKTECTDLIAGEVDLTWDAGIYIQHVNDFDLGINKEVSNTNPNDGDIITYTITVTNNSTTDGSEIVVSDVLPAGLIYQSSTPAGYDTTTSVWTVGNLAAGASTTLTITAQVDYVSLGQQPMFNLGIAAPFNLFVLKDATQPSSDTEGKVAVGRDAHFTGYSVGDKLAPSGGTEDVLIVGRKLTYISGQVYNGNVVYGQYANIQQQNLCSDGTIRQENPVPVDFAQAEIDLNALTAQLANKQVNGTTTFQWGGLSLTGTDPLLNVFEVSGADLSSANNMQIDVPNGSVVLVNIDGTNITWTGGLTVNGTAIGNVLYNFHQAQDIYIQGIDIRGSILAPKAKVNFTTGVINGQMICNYFTGQGQMNLSPFHGNIPGDPEITNCAEINGYDQVDIDLSNNNSCVSLTVNVTNNPNNGGGNSGTSQWVEAGGTGLNEMIWSMYHSRDGLLVGTVGGNIYLNNKRDFKLLNEGMKVMYIWSLYEYDGQIFAGTEQGLYRYDGKVWAQVEIKGDVRAITSLNNILYAAVWGGGVFASKDAGVTWVAINEGLAMSGYAVQTLTVTEKNLFVGTFGLGVLKYDFDAKAWVELPVGYPHIWSLATDVNNSIYAATSGGGVYMSADEGESWVEVNTGLPSMQVYSVSVYGKDVYVSTWAGGVYKYSSTSSKTTRKNSSVSSIPVAGSWASVGMGGIEVSSIMVDETTQTLYAGTSSGVIYKKVDGVTDVAPSDAVPTKFGLEQNYPNPFNPSTQIEFSIAEAGFYSVKVYNVLGQEVATVANQDFSAGKFTFNFDASNLTSGIYFYKLVGENVNITKKMMLLK